jgi:hypothetical protein
LAEEEPIVMRWWFVLVLALSSTAALAQPAGSPSDPAAKAESRRDKIKERVRALRAYTLTAELQLDEQTAAKLFPVLAKFDTEFDKLLTARVDIQRRLHAAGSIKDGKAIDKLIDEAVANQRALWSTEDKRLAELRKILTPAQTARVLVVLPAMERKIQNQLRRAIQRQQRKGRQQPIDPYGDEDAPGVDPFADAPPPRQQKPARAQPKAKKPCDPFSDVHGCAE